MIELSGRDIAPLIKNFALKRDPPRSKPPCDLDEGFIEKLNQFPEPVIHDVLRLGDDAGLT